MRRRGYTLVEVLAVTVLLGLLAAFGAPPLVRALAGDPLARAAERLARDYRDARSRCFGRAVVLTLEPWGFSLAADPAAAPLAIRLPEGVQAAWRRDGRPARQLPLDARGRAPDTELVLRHGRDQRSFAIDGLTGWWQEQVAR